MNCKCFSAWVAAEVAGFVPVRCPGRSFCGWCSRKRATGAHCGSAEGQGEIAASCPSFDAAGLRAESVRFTFSHGSYCFIFTRGERR